MPNDPTTKDGPVNAVTVYDQPCWTLVHADGRPAGFEEQEPHFDTEEQALKAAPGYGDEDRPALNPKRLDGLCAVATAACGHQYDEDDEGVEHWPSAEELRDHLVHEGWRTGSDGEMRHPRGDCEDCDAMPDTPDLTPLPGQIDLLTSAAAPSRRATT